MIFHALENCADLVNNGGPLSQPPAFGSQNIHKLRTWHAPKVSCCNQGQIRLPDLWKARVAHHLRLLLPLLPVPPPRGRGGGGREPARQRLRAGPDVAAEAEDAAGGVRGRPTAGGAARGEVLVVERDGEAAGRVQRAVLGDDLQRASLLQAP